MTATYNQSFKMFQHRPNPEQDFMLFPDSSARAGYASPTPMDMSMSPHSFGFNRSPQDEFIPNPPFDHIPSHPDMNTFLYHGRTSPVQYADEGDMRVPASNLSIASAASPPSTVGSPNSSHAPLPYMHEYTSTNMGVHPGIVGSSDYFTGTEYTAFAGPGMEDFTLLDNKAFVDPSLIHPEIRGSMAPPMSAYDPSGYSPQHPYPHSPSLSGATSPGPVIRTGSRSPYMHTYHQQYSPYPIPPTAGRRPSIGYQSHTSPHDYTYNSDESEKKQKCPHPDCGKNFKDLKAHMLTHQTERPEKCPILNCEYHVKGFARKYDKNRHTLTHYKGTMVCGFCPGSGSSAEKSFNRADVFKRHLTAVHGVEQTPPNSRKKTSPSSTGKKLTGYAPDATGKCSTCSATFSSAQDFYEHLDDCVLRIVQQEDPAEAINAQRLAEVEDDKDVQQTLEKNQLPLATQPVPHSEDEEDDEMGDEEDLFDEAGQIRKLASPTKKKTNPPNGVQKSRGMTHSRGGVPLSTKSKGRKNRQNYPSSWGFDKGQMTMKKRVLAVFDGPRRLAKDDMMLSTEQEVRIKLSDSRAYVTDLDINTMRRAEGFLNATPQEKGIWISDDPTEEDIARMIEMSHQ